VRNAIPGPEFVNAPARECAVRRTPPGDRFVHYHGKDYVLMGLYLVRRHRRKPELHLVLRDACSRPAGLAAAQSRNGRSLQPIVFRTVLDS
jgi:hypothetical protein